MTSTTKKYTLREARQLKGWSRAKLAKRAEISLTAITKIETGSKDDYKTSKGVAIALAETLGLEIDQIDWPRGLSHLGRPAKTGRPIVMKRTTLSLTITAIVVTEEVAVCGDCHMELPLKGQCDFCS